MGVKSRKNGKKRTFVAAMVVFAAIMLALPASALALPAETPDNTPMTDGRVRAIEQVGSNIWLGGRITQVERRDGTVLGNVGNLAVIDSGTNQFKCKDEVPDLGGAGTEVWDIQRYGTTNNLLIAGTFPGPTTKEKNLVLVDGTNCDVIRWYNAPSLKSVLPAPNLGRVYGGGVSLTAFDYATGGKLWTRAKTSVDPDIRHGSAPAYRDLLLDPDGQTIWAACICDFVNGDPAKALVRLGTDGVHDTSWYTKAGEGAFGEAVLLRDGKLYLGAGGSDFVAQYGKNNGGTLGWRRDTSGSVQALEILDGKLIVGGHFFAVADGAGDRCGKGRPGGGQLAPESVCPRRQGIAAYDFTGVLDETWDPKYSGAYSLVWALHAEGTRLHTGGEFDKVSDIEQHNYARLSPVTP